MKRHDRKYFIYLFLRLFFLFSITILQYKSSETQRNLKQNQRIAFESPITNNTDRKDRNENKSKNVIQRTKKKNSKKVLKNQAASSVKIEPEITSKYGWNFTDLVLIYEKYTSVMTDDNTKLGLILSYDRFRDFK